MDFLDDMLMLKLNGPKTLAECEGDEADSCSRLTPFSRACASLWRELYGARFGHHNAKATLAAQEKAKQKPGFRKTVGGVLAAARLAVAESRRVAAARAHAASGAGQASPALGSPKNVFWSASMDQFQKSSDNHTQASWRRAADQARRSFPREVCTSNVMLLLSRSRWCAYPWPRLLSSATPLGNSVDRTPPSLGDIVVLKQTSS